MVSLKQNMFIIVIYNLQQNICTILSTLKDLNICLKLEIFWY